MKKERIFSPFDLNVKQKVGAPQTGQQEAPFSSKSVIVPAPFVL